MMVVPCVCVRARASVCVHFSPGPSVMNGPGLASLLLKQKGILCETNFGLRYKECAYDPP